jgi:hypothetical protein
MMRLSHCQAADLEVKPLQMLAMGIGANGQADMLAIAGVDDLDIAAVEVGSDIKEG